MTYDMANVTTFSHTGVASSSNGSDSLNVRVTWDCENSGGTTTFNITKIEIKDDGCIVYEATGFVELGITVNGVRIIDVSTFHGLAHISVTSPGEWYTVTYNGSPLTGSGTFTTPTSGSTTMVLSNSTKEWAPYPAVWYDFEYDSATYYLMTSLSQTIEVKSTSVIYIDNGSGFDAYEIYIDNGSSWDLYQAYIDNGSSWDECG